MRNHQDVIAPLRDIVEVEEVMPDGSMARFGGPCEDSQGYDLTGLFVGSEGTFGVCTKVWVRLSRNPELYRTLLGVFETVGDATPSPEDLAITRQLEQVARTIGIKNLDVFPLLRTDEL